MVDTEDLKSSGHNGRAGSSPAPGTTIINTQLGVTHKHMRTSHGTQTKLYHRAG